MFDCENLAFDHNALLAVTGPFRSVIESVMVNYPEMIAKVVVFNCPAIVNFFYRTLSPFVPRRTRVCSCNLDFAIL